MGSLVQDCPRCDTKRTTFKVKGQAIVAKNDWQRRYEAFCVCEACGHSTVFVLTDADYMSADLLGAASLEAVQGSINGHVNVHCYVSIKDVASAKPPPHVPEPINAVFKEGAACHAIECHNAAGAMFRLCIDLTTKGLLPDGEVEGLNRHARSNLKARLTWLFNNGHLPPGLEDLADCIREDGNDGAHDGTLTADEAADLLDFTVELLEQVFTVPKRVKLAKERRVKRRQGDDSQ